MNPEYVVCKLDDTSFTIEHGTRPLFLITENTEHAPGGICYPLTQDDVPTTKTLSFIGTADWAGDDNDTRLSKINTILTKTGLAFSAQAPAEKPMELIYDYNERAHVAQSSIVERLKEIGYTVEYRQTNPKELMQEAFMHAFAGVDKAKEVLLTHPRVGPALAVEVSSCGHLTFNQTPHYMNVDDINTVCTYPVLFEQYLSILAKVNTDVEARNALAVIFTMDCIAAALLHTARYQDNPALLGQVLTASEDNATVNVAFEHLGIELMLYVAFDSVRLRSEKGLELVIQGIENIIHAIVAEEHIEHTRSILQDPASLEFFSFISGAIGKGLKEKLNYV